MSESILIGSNKVTEAEVINVPAVPFTRSFHPVHHRQVIDAIRSGVVATGLEIVKTDYVLANNGNRMFGIWDLSGGSDELCWSIGIRNSMDKSMELGITAGTKVFVCENLAFSGEFVEMRKHTKGLSYDELEFIAYRAMKKMVANLIKFQAWHEDLKNFELAEWDAKILLVEIMTNNIIPPSKFARFNELYFGGVYKPTLWGFHETVTDVLRDNNLLTLPKKNKMLNDVLDTYKNFSSIDPPSHLAWYSGEKGQSNCRESGRCSAVKTATIPVKKGSAKRVSRGWYFYTVTVSAFWSSIDRFRRIDSPFSSSL